MSLFSDLPLAFSLLVLLWVFVVGAVIASFLCVVVERVPRKESINGRSHCVCKRQLTALENIPVFSWVVLRGKSKCCNSKIPLFYVLAEAGLGLAWAFSVLVFGFSFLALVFIALSTGLLLIVGFKRIHES